jgi:beta-aspartyl-peptidase (threonine type)
VRALGGTGGVIAMPATGAPNWRFTTPGMNRAMADAGGTRLVALFGDEG